MEKSIFRILVVDDYEPWRRFVATTLNKPPHLQVISEASDGLEATQKALQLQPDLVLLDIGLPTVNGIEAARRILQSSPNIKILFLSEQRSADVAEEALRTGAGGYLVKSHAAELLPAVEAVLEGKRFVSAGLTDYSLEGPNDDAAARRHYHEVGFYADNMSLVDGYVRFIESNLKSGNAVIAVLNGAHRASVLPRLDADDVDVAAAIEQGNYISLDASEALSRLTVDDMPDPVRCAKIVGELITKAAKSLKGKQARVVVCGEIAPTLLSQGNAEGAIRLEHLWDEITRRHGVSTLCGYLLDGPLSEGNPIFERICAEHTAVQTG